MVSDGHRLWQWVCGLWVVYDGRPEEERLWIAGLEIEDNFRALKGRGKKRESVAKDSADDGQSCKEKRKQENRREEK